ncbi:transcription-repair coupling factor [Anaerococcus sp. Marseille-P9784]|uniref:transcription-repair coupling factor n=1 Tax=Anaerococcus sp. Marseille-P9784 TaxID=2614127 RepID=UPI00124A6CDB|nr:transcription-repair coupling factor [Anaerococcus sp. Marseille-P9784]
MNKEKNFLINRLNNLEQLNIIKENITKKSPIQIHGLSDGIKTHLVLSIFESLNQNLILIVENEKIAKEYLNIINSIEDVAFFYPAREINFYNIKSIDEKISANRLEILIKQSKGEKFITITTLEAIKNKLTTLSQFNNNFVKISSEDEIDQDEFIKKLINLNYSLSSLVENKGEFAKRGSIIDIWPINYENPIRIELFDNEIDSIRFFDKSTQRTIEKINEFTISTTNELSYESKDFDEVTKLITDEISKLSKNIKTSSDQKLKDKYLQILDFINNRSYISNLDLINPYRATNYQNFLDYLSEDTVFIFDDVNRIYDQNEKSDLEFLEAVTYQRDRGEVFSSFNNLLVDSKIIYEQVKKFNIINFTSLLKKSKLFYPKQLIELKTIEVEHFNNNLGQFIETISNLPVNCKAYALLPNSIKSQNLLEEFNNRENFDVSFSDNTKLTLLDIQAKDGYYIRDANLFVFNENNIFTTNRKNYHKKTKSKLSSSDIINYSDLTIGDYVVHENNGIGIYSGLEKIIVNNIQKDFIVINYKGNDKVFVPIDQMDLVSKYIGNKGEKPTLSSLGSQSWVKAKQRARRAVNEIADDLVKLYAKRSKEKGHAFSKDSTWQNEFEDSFFYEETISQLRSIEEIKEDMQTDRPMDRLLTGDVGYGKTEVALRAAFKAILDGYQVAFLVPTTILANQHYETSKERFKNFPVEIQMLSRFVSKNKQKEILKDLKSGKVDMVIATHRLLSKDVKFNKLGLLIIDEEQRFGVKDKEKLKTLKTNIDVLTLSATPIPRTLQMSLAGIRDLSTLDEPPEERMPVNTYVLEYDDNIIKSAIEKELNRNGQVYFVYNRVYNITSIFNHLKTLIPDARIEIIHGKLSPKQIESIMNDFILGDIDILLSTTIIETGMDIANVNTLIVYDADNMGLAQLYQLKGRIGRSNRSSYAYFTYRKGKVLSEVSEKRLKSIRDFSDFGSGYKIAMKDLELRGAGNLLGESQSGHVSSIGYDLYVKFLQEAVSKASGKEIKENKSNDVYIDIKVDAYIPNSYISDQSQKIEIYKRIAKIENSHDYDILVEDLIDIYGDIPIMVDNIMYVSLIKSLAGETGFKEIREKNSSINLYFENRDLFSIEELKEISQNYKSEMKINLSTNPSFILPASKTKLLDTYEFLNTIRKIRSKNEKIK